MRESELLRWLVVAFVGVLQFLALRYVVTLAESVKETTQAGNRMLVIVAQLQRDVDFLMQRTHRRREADFFSHEGAEL